MIIVTRQRPRCAKGHFIQNPPSGCGDLHSPMIAICIDMLDSAASPSRRPARRHQVGRQPLRSLHVMGVMGTEWASKPSVGCGHTAARADCSKSHIEGGNICQPGAQAALDGSGAPHVFSPRVTSVSEVRPRARSKQQCRARAAGHDTSCAPGGVLGAAAGEAPSGAAKLMRSSSTRLPMRRAHQSRLAGAAAVGHRTRPKAACTCT